MPATRTAKRGSSFVFMALVSCDSDSGAESRTYGYDGDLCLLVSCSILRGTAVSDQDRFGVDWRFSEDMKDPVVGVRSAVGSSPY